MLSQARIVLQGQSAYAHEQEALAFIREALPDVDPYNVWELVEFVEPSTGRLLEVDVLILGYSALYLVEIKSGPGLYEGDTVDWYRTPPGEPARYMDPPLRLTNFKSKVLASLLQSKLPHNVRCPWVQPLVFLSHENVETRFRNWGDTAVVTRRNFLEAVKLHRFTGSDQKERPRVNTPQMGAVAKALEDIGVRASKGVARIGAYELGAILEQGSGYQDRAAQHADTPALRRRARIYLVPQQTSVERRQQLRRAADREVRLLENVKDHKSILRAVDYVTDSPLGPTLLFDAFDGIPLDAFLRKHPDLSFGARIDLIEKIGRALHHCHRREVVHGGIAPTSVLVREDDGGALDVRLYNFQLGMGLDVTPTLHWSAIADEPWALYQAPELRENPEARGPVSDAFSLGTLAYLILTGRPPADSVREIDERLARAHELDPRAHADGIPDGVALAITGATASKPVNRAHDIGEWLDFLIEMATKPETEERPPEISPLEARKGDVLGGDLRVRGVLGQGASSRVLEVEKDGKPYALKCALTPEDDGRLKEEARALDSLRHSRIVQLFEVRTLGGRTCLLMAKAGESSLQRHLAREGAVSLDFASRFGEDLLQALEELEEHQILHRDVKPANLGVGTVGKKALHLTLFDLSLALDLKGNQAEELSRSHFGVGTAVYRDPFLRLRCLWDGAADRWSAAVTLHEMLTGVRPSFSVDGSAALESESQIVLAAERFDASVRGQLITFFERAFHRSAEQRFESAGEMRRAWSRSFEATVSTSAALTASADGTSSDEPSEKTPTTDAEIAAIQPETPIEALPLSLRAKNALDRAGLLIARDLLSLPDNRVSAVRGVGQLVALEILNFRTRWNDLRKLSPADDKPFFPAYRGEDILVSTAGLPRESVAVLQDAGLHTLRAVALAPERNLEALAKRGALSLEAIRKVIEDENTRSNERRRPTTLEGWVDALLPDTKKSKSTKNLRALFGLADPFLGRIDVPVAEVAKSLGMTPANLYVQLGKEREKWVAHGAFSELVRLAHGVVDDAGGALPVHKAAESLLERLPGDGTSSRSLAVACAAALLRIVAHVERDEPDGLQWERLDGTAWLFGSATLSPSVQELGRVADELAARSVLASPGEVLRLLSAAVSGTLLEGLPAERLTELATLASKGAARSTRLEIYPRGLTPERALALSGAVLTGDVSPAAIHQRVLARYPEAAPLPDHPELDALVAKLGLKWDDDRKIYVRPGERRGTQHTSLPSVAGLTTLPSSQRLIDPRHIALDEFEEKLRITIDRRTLKVLAVRANYGAEAALRLTRVLGIRRVSLDAELSAATHALAKEQDVAEDVIYAADQLGPGGPDWGELRNLMQQAASRVAQALFPNREPLLVVQPGLLARYQLHGLLRAMLDASRDPKTAAVFLLVPAHDTAAVPKINDDLVIPEVGLPQTLWVPPEWVMTRGKDAA